MLHALVELVGRTGSGEFQLRYQDEEQPVVWMAVAKYQNKKAVPNLGGAGKSLREHHMAECAAALDPILAVYRLAERLVDGGSCVHCGKTTMLHDSWQSPPPESEKEWFCHFVYDPELATYIQGCKA